jgi:hypothetical protein
MRQRYWRHNLLRYDKDHTGQLSRADLYDALEVTGLDISHDQIDTFFKDHDKDPDADELTIEEAMICLEKEFGFKKILKDEADEREVEAATTAVDNDASVMLDKPISLSLDNGRPGSPDQPRPISPDHPRLRPIRSRSSMFGHSRESIHELDIQLYDLFMSHPAVYFANEADQENGINPLIPASAIPSILRKFGENYALELLEPEDEEQLKLVVAGIPDAPVGPSFLSGFIAKVTGMGVDEESNSTTENDSVHASLPSLPTEEEARGRDSAQQTPVPGKSRATSRDSQITSFQVGDAPPATPKPPSVFDVRQRSTPLGAVAPPSSWNAKPTPASKRRRSSVGSIGSRTTTDTEVCLSGIHWWVGSNFSFQSRANYHCRYPPGKLPHLSRPAQLVCPDSPFHPSQIRRTQLPMSLLAQPLERAPHLRKVSIAFASRIAGKTPSVPLTLNTALVLNESEAEQELA